MARFQLTEEKLQAIAAVIAPIAGWSRECDINGDDVGYFEADAIVPTDTALEEWIEAQGEPVQNGSVWVFTNTKTSKRTNHPRRTVIDTRTIYVVEIDNGTAAFIG